MRAALSAAATRPSHWRNVRYSLTRSRRLRAPPHALPAGDKPQLGTLDIIARAVPDRRPRRFSAVILLRAGALGWDGLGITAQVSSLGGRAHRKACDAPRFAAYSPLGKPSGASRP